MICRGDARRCAAALYFAHSTPGELETMLARTVLRRFARGDAIMRRGDPATSMIVILQGSMRIAVTSADYTEVCAGSYSKPESFEPVARKIPIQKYDVRALA